MLCLAIFQKILNQECPLNINAQIFSSPNSKTLKAAITFADGLKAETVLMRHCAGRNTICLSSQIGCPMNCSFCATGKMGFKRNLTVTEIIEQIVFFARILKKEKQRITNVVFMGMGEPFLNYSNVLAAIKIINDPRGLGIGARHISVSTVGVIEGIEN